MERTVQDNRYKRMLLGNLFGATGGNFAGNVYTDDGLCPTINTVGGGHRQPMILIKQATEQGYTPCEIGGVCDLSDTTSRTRRGRVIEQGRVAPTLTTENMPNVLEMGSKDFSNFIYEIDGEKHYVLIRKLTPKECWRLMAFTDEDFDKAAEVNSNTQLYKQAGNAICVNVLEMIFGQMIPGKEDYYKEKYT